MSDTFTLGRTSSVAVQSEQQTVQLLEVQDQVSIMKTLDHPNVVHFHDCFTLHNPVDGSYALCIVMELVEGMNLGTYLENTAREKPRIEVVMKWFTGLLDALAYFESKGILHRDLKPANILISKQGSVKISDFGVSKTNFKGQLNLTICGTPCFMSPEVLSAQPYTDRCDIWSLGCILYAVATGTPPKGILNPTPEFFDTIEDRSVCLILQMMLQRNPKERPSAKELQREAVVEAWTVLTMEKLNLNEVPEPKIASYLLPFISALQVDDVVFRGRGIEYLRKHCKQPKVRKCFLELHGIELLCTSLNEQQGQQKRALAFATVPQVVALLSLFLETNHYRETIYQLKAGGGIKKLMALFRECVAVKLVPVVSALLCIVVLEFPGYHYLEDEGIELLLGNWMEREPPHLQSTCTLYAHLPVVRDNDVLLHFLRYIQTNDTSLLYEHFVCFCNSKFDPSLVVCEFNLPVVATIIEQLLTMVKTDQPKLHEFLTCVYSLVESYDELEKAAAAKSMCSFNVTGRMLVSKSAFSCRQCFGEDPQYFCISCYRKCHFGHKHTQSQPRNVVSYCNCLKTCQAKTETPNLDYLTLDLVPVRHYLQQPMLDFKHSLKSQEIVFCQPTSSMATAIVCSFTLLEGKNLRATQFYAEVSILKEKSRIRCAVGVCKELSSRDMPPVNFFPGFFPESVAIHSHNGKVYSAVRGTGEDLYSKKACGPQFGVAHTVGVGVLGDGSIYFTLDGYYLGEMCKAGTISPQSVFNFCVGAEKPGLRVRYQLHPPFLFNHAKLMQLAVTLKPSQNKCALRLISNEKFLTSVLSVSCKPDILVSLLLPIIEQNPMILRNIEASLLANLQNILEGTVECTDNPMVQRKAGQILALIKIKQGPEKRTSMQPSIAPEVTGTRPQLTARKSVG
ncbi:CAMK family protein kinase [Pelomyxa schiedti]|nr:CAMK family protein kinase [Pelomyxa schiedti]